MDTQENEKVSLRESIQEIIADYIPMAQAETLHEIVDKILEAIESRDISRMN